MKRLTTLVLTTSILINILLSMTMYYYFQVVPEKERNKAKNEIEGLINIYKSIREFSDERVTPGDNSVTFNVANFKTVGEWRLDKDNGKAVEKVFDIIEEFIKKHNNYFLVIDGHADASKATDDFNMELSYKRAVSVVSYLKKHIADRKQVAINFDDVFVRSYGNSRMIDKDSKSSRNRRVEIGVIRKAKHDN